MKKKSSNPVVTQKERDVNVKVTERDQLAERITGIHSISDNDHFFLFSKQAKVIADFILNARPEKKDIYACDLRVEMGFNDCLEEWTSNMMKGSNDGD